MLIRFRNYLLPYSSNLHFILWHAMRSRVKTSSETGARPIFRLIPREFHGTPSLALATASSSTSEGRRTTAAEDEAQKQQSASEDDETAKSNPTTDSSSNIAGQQQEVIAKRKQQRSKQQKLGRRELLMILFMALVWPIYLFPKELERFRFEEIFDQRDRINNDYERALQRRRQYLAEQEAKDGQPTI